MNAVVPTKNPAVVKVLTRAFIEMRSKVEGAAKRLRYAHNQVQTEEALIDEYMRDMVALGNALRDAGGEIPPEGADEP
jgi:hypothetical protein